MNSNVMKKLVLIFLLAIGMASLGHAQMFYPSVDKTEKHIYDFLKRGNFKKYAKTPRVRPDDYYSPKHLKVMVKTTLARITISDKSYVAHTSKGKKSKSAEEIARK